MVAMTSPPTKRIKLELESSPPPELQSGDITELEDSDAEHCSICLQPYADRTMIPTCSHEFCFECLLIWTEQSRRCPLCSQDVGKYLMHHIRSKYDYQKHYLPPLRTSPQPESPAVIQANARQRVARRREILWGQRRRRELEEADELERAIEKRRWVYRHRLYAKHVASNPYTRYRPFPTPAQFAASQDSISRATVFIRRELRVWSELDVEFLTTFMVSLMKSLDIRSEPAVRLLSEFLDMDAEGGHERANAEHFAHELYCYLRSPYRDLSAYDKNVQYDAPPNVPMPNAPQRVSRRWYSGSRSRSRSRTRSRDDSARHSPSPRRRPHPRSQSPASRDSAPPVRSLREETKNLRARDEDRHEHRFGRSQRPRSHSTDSVTSGLLPDHRTAQPSHATGRGGSNGTDDRCDRKGKQRAEDVNADNSPTPSSRQADAIALGGGDDAGRHTTARGSSVPRFEDNDAVLSTPPRTAGVSTASATDVAEASASGPAPRQAKQPIRIRRNAWQTMQQHLAGGSRELRPIGQREGGSGPEPVPSSQSQAPAAPASVSGDQALRPEDVDAPPSDDTVPSLLLRLSDPVSSTAAYSRAVVNPGGPGSRRDTLSALKASKSTSTAATVVRTQARPDRPSSSEDPPAASRRTSDTQHSGTAGRHSSEKHHSAGTSVAGGSAAGSDMSISISSASHPAGQGKGSGAIPADPRFLLMQKLELEKRSLAGTVPTPTAENLEAQLSSSSSSAPALTHPRDGPGESQAGVSSAGTRAGAGAGTRDTPADLNVVAAESELELDAGRREAQLRSQAQLRVRLAAAKRAAFKLQGASAVESGAGNGTGHGPGNRTGDGADTAAGDSSPSHLEGLMSQERLLKNRLKSRKA